MMRCAFALPQQQMGLDGTCKSVRIGNYFFRISNKRLRAPGSASPRVSSALRR
jgi:hypothetical protein